MRKIELMWLRTREKQLQREKRVLHAQLLRIRSLYTQLQQLLGKRHKLKYLITNNTFSTTKFTGY